MTTHTHALTIQQAIERAVEDIEKGEHGLPLHAIQSPIDLRDAMRSALARLTSGREYTRARTIARTQLLREREGLTMPGGTDNARLPMC